MKLTRNNKCSKKYFLITDVERICFFAGLLTEFHICYTTGQAVVLWDHKVGKNSHSGSAVCGVTHKKLLVKKMLFRWPYTNLKVVWTRWVIRYIYIQGVPPLCWHFRTKFWNFAYVIFQFSKFSPNLSTYRWDSLQFGYGDWLIFDPFHVHLQFSVSLL